MSHWCDIIPYLLPLVVSKVIAIVDPSRVGARKVNFIVSIHELCAWNMVFLTLTNLALYLNTYGWLFWEQNHQSLVFWLFYYLQPWGMFQLGLALVPSAPWPRPAEAAAARGPGTVSYLTRTSVANQNWFQVKNTRRILRPIKFEISRHQRARSIGHGMQR